ncbi:MAG TPA: c-type cytochrome [Candidatus Acidoferrales bacterium]|jgi:putative heme-binding domain-containing protein|nr:c-type cytochrome [Candidatus Acidoferrales bacterium]
MTSIQSRWITAAVFVVAAAAAGTIAGPAGARQNQANASPAAKPEDQSPGKQLFEQRCSTCHGLDGGGAMGPNIQGIPFRLGADPVKAIIKNGMAGGGMPAFAGQLDDAQIQQIVDYLLTLQRKDSTPVTGDPAKGKEVYDASACGSCHMIAGQGGDAGPELTTVGSLRGAGYLRSAVLYPGTDLPQEHVFVESGGQLDYLFIHVVTKDGKSYDGTRVAEDSFRIVIKNAEGNFLSFRKADLRTLDREPGKSVMPSVKGKLTDEQVNDLVAYLASLKGAQ